MDTATVTILATSINLLSDNHNHKHRPQLMQPGRLGAPFVQMPQHSFRLDAVWRVQGGEFPMEDPGRVYYKLGVADGVGGGTLSVWDASWKQSTIQCYK